MSKQRLCPIILTILLILSATACTTESDQGAPVITTKPSTGKIYLYGETHGVEAILAQELERWQEYYHEENMRHLFVELPYYTAEYLNLYMTAENDDILDTVYEDWAGTAIYTSAVKDFYKQIKETCPETVFHGTDVGHQYDTTGARFLTYLENSGLRESEQYALAEQAIEQGEEYYNRNDYGYRENRMVENFVRAFDGLNGENIMGIYGTAHTAVNAMATGSQKVASMAGQLHERYSDALHIEDLKEVTQPLHMDHIRVGSTVYQAAYLGRQDLSQMLPDYLYRDFWRLENAYEDFKNCLKTGDVLPYDNYPAQLEAEQVFVIDYVLKDGTTQRKYYRSDGADWQGRPSTEEFVVE